MSKVIIIGGGIIGLSSALYLRKSGWDVTVIDKGDFLDNCSYGNAGYICPSHFIPMATPGIVKQGLKWMWNSKSPFYVQPRLDLSLVSWGLKFMRSANPEKVEAAAVPLRDIALLSKKEYEQWTRVPGLQFAYEHKGLIEIFQTQEAADHAVHTLEKAHRLGLQDTVMLSKEELDQLEPQTRIHAIGALFFKGDAHCYPNKLMQQLLVHLRDAGVAFVKNTEVTGFETGGGRIKKIIAGDQSFEADEIVLATGSWSRQTAKLLGLKIPMMPGRGYSVTLENSPYKINYPSILVEGRVAMTPMDGNKIRFGGTMEITSHKTAPRMSRVQGILDAVKRYYPEFDVPLPAIENTWYGYRPCSADGLPYIGRVKKYNNLTVATGHSMLGLSLGAGTGKLVNELVNRVPASMDLRPFAVERFG
ncbi:MAG: FAD-binding oxidoreductase [Sphingobacteriales bacterium]|nr:FAD-binding oxidoreductase [Sphingobacteriales bacterium]